jgi:hypothetical protein
MKNKKIDFINISIKDRELLDKLSKNKNFKSYLKDHKEIHADFSSLLEKKKPHFTYCVATSGDKLLSLIITADMTEDHPEYIKPWIEEEKKTLWMNLIFLDKVEETELLLAFTTHCSKDNGALLADPEVKEESIIALYEAAGFTRVGTYIKGQGFFKGTSHYVMKLKIS